MTDRELLALAAKAAGIDVRWMALTGFNIVSGDGMGRYWRPLEDDGDAMRLAVRLNMGVRSNGPEHWQSPNCTIVLFGEHSRLTQKHNGDAGNATRRAIVRAAAAVAKTGDTNV